MPQEVRALHEIQMLKEQIYSPNIQTSHVLEQQIKYKPITYFLQFKPSNSFTSSYRIQG